MWRVLHCVVKKVSLTYLFVRIPWKVIRTKFLLNGVLFQNGSSFSLLLRERRKQRMWCIDWIQSNRIIRTSLILEFQTLTWNSRIKGYYSPCMWQSTCVTQQLHFSLLQTARSCLVNSIVLIEKIKYKDWRHSHLRLFPTHVSAGCF